MNIFHTFSSVSIVDFEQVIVSWVHTNEWSLITKQYSDFVKNLTKCYDEQKSNFCASNKLKQTGN